MVNGSRAVFRAKGFQVLIADNVAEFYGQHEQQAWGLNDDFPCVAPPFDAFFIEWKHPDVMLIGNKRVEQIKSLYCGVSVWAIPAGAHKELCQNGIIAPAGKERDKLLQLHEQFESRLKWVFRMDRWIWFPQMAGPCFTEDVCCPFVSDKGEVLESYLVPGRWRLLPDVQSRDGFELNPAPEFHVAMLALSFLNCKNVARQDATQEEGPSDKWLRRMKQPKLRYHVLNIEPMKQVLRTEGGVEHNGLKKALHICRGHFATYTDDKPLFGRVTGTFWKPAHVRGSIDRGAVVKDYAVKV